MANQSKKEELLRRFLDGELTPEEEPGVLHMIADDHEMREMLRFERLLFQSFGRNSDAESFSVPRGFDDNVMSRISAQPAHGTAIGIWDSLSSILETLFTPRQLALRPVYILAALLIMIIPFVLPLNSVEHQEFAEDFHQPSIELVAEQDYQVWIRFVYFDDNAGSIAVAGDFSDWEPVSLSNEIIDNRQVWTGLIPVTKQEHRYMFVKDGEHWVTDPLAEVQRDDGFGNKNAVLFL